MTYLDIITIIKSHRMWLNFGSAKFTGVSNVTIPTSYSRSPDDIRQYSRSWTIALIALDLKVTVSEPSSISCSPKKYSGIYYSYKIIISTYLTQHHGDVIPQKVRSANDREVLKTVTSSEDMTIRQKCSSASTALVVLRRSQEQQCGPGKLVDLSLLTANDNRLIMK